MTGLALFQQYHSATGLGGKIQHFNFSI